MPRWCASRSRAVRGRTKCATSAMWTPSRQCPLSSCSNEMASSKSRASTGSMVTIVSPRQIQPMVERFVELLGLLPALFQGILGELVRQTELAYDRQRIDARFALRPEHFEQDHLRRRRPAKGIGPFP